ncbi:MAG TPA: hypothetical protein VJ783_22135 [Pirellulales bacterium]|nr:hypothetical protein [Pirellulales bacterium]
MPRIETRQAHQLAYRQRFSRPVRWLGCAGLMTGVFLALMPWIFRSRPGDASTRTSAGALLLTAVSAGLWWGRRGKLIDREAGTISFWWGAPWALARTTYELAAFQSLVVAPHEEGGRLCWRVALLAADEERLDLFDLSDAASAQQAAERIGQFLSLPVKVLDAPPPAESSPGDEAA